MTAALEGAPPGARVLVGGLGVGFSLVAALADPRVAAVTVVEVRPDIVRWHDPGQALARWSAGALADPRTRVVVADLLTWLRTTDERFDAICLDTDNGPDWLVHSDNAGLWDGVGTPAGSPTRCGSGGPPERRHTARTPGRPRHRTAQGRLSTRCSRTFASPTER